MSKDIISGLKPEILWSRFYDISQIPRPSKKEEKIVEYVRNFATENQFEMIEDKVGNIVIKVPATSGFESSPTVVLQGHVDMVCEKNKGTEHDFDNDAIKLVIEGDWMAADGTTLGADNGIGIAAAMAAATDDDVIHGPLELLCTIDEETGMTGVNNLKPGFIEGKLLLNMDSEEDGAFYVGCCGGIDTVGVFDIPYKAVDKKLAAYELMITGLKGGHSGLDIQNGRANAIKLLGLLLNRMGKIKYRISEINGGSKRNAIPREAEAVLLIRPKDEDKIKKIIKKFVSDTLLEFQTNDCGLQVTFEKKDGKYEKTFRKKFIQKIINVILSLPHGIVAMSPDIPDLVESSTNLATFFTEGEKLRIGTSQRSSIESAKLNISNSVKSVLRLAEANEIIAGDGYPGWLPNMDSKILKISKDVFKNIFGKDPEVKAIHAGLECGILGNKYPGLDMISFGPTITGAHSPDERVNINDVEKFYILLKGILADFATQK
jgi:dipeptidase D